MHGLFAAGGYGVACQDKRGKQQKQGLCWEEPATAVDLSSFMGSNDMPATASPCVQRQPALPPSHPSTGDCLIYVPFLSLSIPKFPWAWLLLAKGKHSKKKITPFFLAAPAVAAKKKRCAFLPIEINVVGATYTYSPVLSILAQFLFEMSLCVGGRSGANPSTGKEENHALS